MTDDIEVMDRIAMTKERIRQRAIELRKDNLSNGLTFMVFSEDLPDGQSYLEYPDGHIEIAGLAENGDEMNLVSIRTLTEFETIRVRKEHRLQ